MPLDSVSQIIQKLDASVPEEHSNKSSSFFHKDQNFSTNNVMPVECPRNLKAFNFTLCGKSTSKTSTLFPTKKANPHKSNQDQQRTVLQRVECKNHHVKIIISSD